MYNHFKKCSVDVKIYLQNCRVSLVDPGISSVPNEEKGRISKEDHTENSTDSGGEETNYHQGRIPCSADILRAYSSEEGNYDF